MAEDTGEHFRASPSRRRRRQIGECGVECRRERGREFRIRSHRLYVQQERLFGAVDSLAADHERRHQPRRVTYVATSQRGSRTASRDTSSSGERGRYRVGPVYTDRIAWSLGAVHTLGRHDRHRRGEAVGDRSRTSADRRCRRPRSTEVVRRRPSDSAAPPAAFLTRYNGTDATSVQRPNSEAWSAASRS